MSESKTKIIVTLGPATRTEEALRKLKDQGVDFVRVNLSHSSLDDLKYFIGLAKLVGVPFVLDTEGSQMRSGPVAGGSLEIHEGHRVHLWGKEVMGDASQISIKPYAVLDQLEPGDLIHLDFDNLILRVSDVSTALNGYITATAVASGVLGSNKAIIVDPARPKQFDLPCLSPKDYEAIAIGLVAGVEYIAASFMRSREFVECVRAATQGRMKIISKIECVDGLNNLDEIIVASDFLLIDRGDLSKEVPIEKVPLLQKMILHRARALGKGVFVATNLLETMLEKTKPTRAEVHDIVNTILDGASGLALAAETALGKHPFACVATLQKIIRHVGATVPEELRKDRDTALVNHLQRTEYLTEVDQASALTPPHGGKLVDRVLQQMPDPAILASLPRLQLDETTQMDVEQIAIGTFSPLEGFMGREEVESVLNTTRLSSGVIWPIPIVLDVSEEDAARITVGGVVALWGERTDRPLALLQVSEKYRFDKNEFAQKLYGTLDSNHPGVRRVLAMKPVFLAGKIDLLYRRPTLTKEYELTPRQVRRLFAERGWRKVVGFHTRNVIHRSHEFIQLKALADNLCDGLFVHPVIGKKKPGDFQSPFIIKSYELMMQDFYPKNKVVLATFATFSRYAGPREALFTAICRKNFGCSHFIVGRDHTGVGKFYAPTASHGIFDQFPDLGITPVRFGQVFYSARAGDHIHEFDAPDHPEDDRLQISGTQARQMFERGEVPPEWFMRPEIARLIIEAIERGEEVFVKE